jgi:hypothetical protein
MLLLNVPKSPIPRSLEVFKKHPDINTIIEWGKKENVKDFSHLQIIPIEIPYCHLLR